MGSRFQFYPEMIQLDPISRNRHGQFLAHIPYFTTVMSRELLCQ
jgi:hypothetical protein